jgi:Zn-dependent protease
MILVSSLTGFGFGWGKPVPVNPYNLRFGPRVGMALTAFAGPFSNVLLATLLAIPLRLVGGMPQMAYVVLWTAISTNVALAVFNLLPLPPLDGFSVLRGLFSTIPARWAAGVNTLIDNVARLGPMLFVLILFADQALPGRGIIWTVLGPFYDALMWLILESGA